jgi:hypothetical protein
MKMIGSGEWGGAWGSCPHPINPERRDIMSKFSTVRIGDVYPEHPGWSSKDSVCTHPEHNPPMYMVFKPGRYRHTCPQCGKIVEFDVYPEGGST